MFIYAYILLTYIRKFRITLFKEYKSNGIIISWQPKRRNFIFSSLLNSYSKIVYTHQKPVSLSWVYVHQFQLEPVHELIFLMVVGVTRTLSVSSSHKWPKIELRLSGCCQSSIIMLTKKDPAITLLKNNKWTLKTMSDSIPWVCRWTLKAA